MFSVMSKGGGRRRPARRPARRAGSAFAQGPAAAVENTNNQPRNFKSFAAGWGVSKLTIGNFVEVAPVIAAPAGQNLAADEPSVWV